VTSTLTPDSQFVDADGVPIHVLRWANPGASPLVLLHATGFLAALWRRVAERLWDAYDVYAIDVRGHGRSGHPESLYNFDELSSDVTAVLDALHLRDVYTVGHSMGGGLAVMIAARRPELVGRIFAIEPIVPTNTWRQSDHAPMDSQDLATASRKRRPGFASREEVVTRWRDRPPFSNWDSQVFDDYVMHGFEEQGDGSVLLRCPPRLEARTFEAARDFDAEPFLASVACPVLLVQGAETSPWFDSMLAQAAATLPDGRRLTIPGVGHLAPMEAPGTIAQEIRDFGSVD
jgi:pimeloyl-ACP methyl ester carboxylesterase